MTYMLNMELVYVFDIKVLHLLSHFFFTRMRLLYIEIAS